MVGYRLSSSLDPSAEFEIDIAFIQVMRFLSFRSSFSVFAAWWKAEFLKLGYARSVHSDMSPASPQSYQRNDLVHCKFFCGLTNPIRRFAHRRGIFGF